MGYRQAAGTGVVAFVSNGGYIDGNTANGMRLALAADYSTIYVYNLRGNQRTSGELSRKEGGKIFGSSSRNTVACFIGIKDSNRTGTCEIHYCDIGNYLTREQKLRIVAESDIETLDWQTVTPNNYGDWIDLRDDEYKSWPAIGEKHDPEQATVFISYSRGLETGRDAWIYNYSRATVKESCLSTIQFYERVRQWYDSWLAEENLTRTKDSRDHFLREKGQIVNDPHSISWTLSLRNRLNAEALRLTMILPLHSPACTDLFASSTHTSIAR